ncbi:TPA: hypothetical protein ACP0O4_001672 [Streptococcus pyogenes]
MGFNYGKKKYNAYRKRNFSISDNQRKGYAEQMKELEEKFYDLPGWFLSSMKDSAYKSFKNYEVRLSNHSADNKYHDLENGKLLVNIKCSKLSFIDVIEHTLTKILSVIDEQDLGKYRFINVNLTTSKINCFYKGYKTKKDTVDFPN